MSAQQKADLPPPFGKQTGALLRVFDRIIVLSTLFISLCTCWDINRQNPVQQR